MEINRNNNDVQKNKKPVWMIVLAVVFFPISITYMVLKSQKIKAPIKAVIIVALWIFVIIVGNAESDETATPDEYDTELSSDITSSEQEKPSVDMESENKEEETVENNKGEYYVIDTFIEKYNAIANTPMTDATAIDIYDKAGGYYRTEYRTLNGALAKICNVGDATIEIVSTDELFTGSNIRIYLTTDSIDLAEEVFTSIVKIVYPTITEEQLNEGIEDLHSDSSSSLDDIVFYYLQSRNELFMNNVMYAE